jgi:uncharacterized RDD family membrane protein YckC
MSMPDDSWSEHLRARPHLDHVHDDVLCCYDWLCNARWGRTLGKCVVGIKVVHCGVARRPGVFRSLARKAIIFGVPTAVVGCQLVAVMMDRLADALVVTMLVWTAIASALSLLLPTRRALHDYLSGTEVVQDRSGRVWSLSTKSLE